MIPTCVRIVLILSGSVTQNEFNSVLGKFPVQLEWGDCDPAGIIFYPTYFRWFDAATWSMFAAAGYHAKRMRAEHRSMPLVGAECEFKNPAEQEDRCEICSRIARWGGKSFVVAHEVVRTDGVLLARGSETRVWGRYQAGPGTPLKGQEIGEDLKALFRAR
ncbi:MAG: acyl-CoA thioesterase [Candidatus Parcubacteria bacterium]|nr:acyl-CoA thioesterase [Burkholderiales bacterium]